jgi:Na+-driven multidrug efflux pump
VPSGVQTFLFAAGLTALFAIIDRVGTAEAAAANVLMNISLVAFLPGLGLGLASASLVGQALGRRDVDDAARWGWEVVRIGAVMMAAIGLPMAIAPELLLSPFFSGETEPLALAVGPLRLVGLTIGIEALTMVLLNSIVGAGATTLALIIAVAMQWGLFLPLAYLVGPVLGGGLMTIWIVNVGYRALMGLILVAVWKSRRWAKVRV